jgi:hypothetical protein
MRKALGLLILTFGLPLLSATLVAAAPDATVRVDTVPGQSLNTIVEQRAERSWPWYLTRASGLIAGVSLIALLLSGIGSVTGHFFRFLEPLTAWATHRAIGIVFAASVVVHMTTLLFDHFVPFTLGEVLVPWASNYQSVSLLGLNLGSVFVALGILAFYGALIIVITSFLWVDKKPRRWKIYHYISYFILFAVFLHGLFLGTDLGSGLGRILWYIGGLAILFAIIIRLRRVRSI